MAKIVGCCGTGCPLKETCYRFLAPKTARGENFVDGPPHSEGECEFYWGEAPGFMIKEHEDATMLQKAEYNYVSPDHYRSSSSGMEVFEMMIAIWGRDKYIAFCEMNAFKYRMRAGKKPGQAASLDLDKANWYENQINRLK